MSVGELGNSGPGTVAKPADWATAARARRAHKRRSADGGAVGEHERLRHTRRAAPLPQPGDRANLDDDTAGRDARRHARYEIAETLQRYHWARYGPRKDPTTGEWSNAPRPATCGTAFGQGVALSVAAVDDTGAPLPADEDPKGKGRRAQITGVETCGNPNVCLKCGAKIRGRRAVDIGRVLRTHIKGGGHAYFLTLTFSHERSERAANVIDDALNAWSKMLQAGGWRRMKQATGITAFIRVTEITHGNNGWHPHHHVALLTNRPIHFDDVDGGHLEQVRCQVGRLWDNQVNKLDRQVHPVIGVTLVPIRDDNGIGAYVSKIELELVRSDLKVGRNTGSRSHWQVGAAAAEHGDPTDIALWHDFFQSVVTDNKRRRYFSTTPGLWKTYGIEELTDDEIASQQLEATPLVEIDRRVYTDAIRSERPVLAELRALAESGAPPELLTIVLGRRLGQTLELLDLGPGQAPVIRSTTPTRSTQ